MKQTITILGVFLCSVAFAQIPNYVPANGLIGYWPFTGNANDVSGNNLNGSATGVTLVADRNNNSNSAYRFSTSGWNPGTQLSEVFIPFNNIINTSQITVSAWIKPSDWGWPGSMGQIIARNEQGYSTPNGQCWGLAVSTLQSPLNNGECHSWLFEQSQNISEIIGNQVPTNEWSLLTMTYDGSSHKQYINGTLTSSTQVSNGFTLNQQGTSGLSVGMSRQANGFWQPYNGIIDDIGIWNRALTQQEVTALFNGADTTSPCTVYDTTYVTVYDTVKVYDTITTTISVTDTLLIDFTTGIAPPNNANTLKVYPNPAKDHLIINNGNLFAMSGYSIKITNLLGQVVFNQPVNQAQFYIDLSSWGGNGTYILYIIDGQQTVKETKEIVLH